MKAFLLITAAVSLVYTVFVIGPSATVFFTFFVPFKAPLHEGKKAKNSYLRPYNKQLERARKAINSLESTPITLTARDGVALKGRFYSHQSKKTVVFAHGYRTKPLTNMPVQFALFYNEGFNLLCFDQRAHWESGGSFSGFGILEQYDLMEWVSWVLANTQTEEVLIYGTSMGCVATGFASDKLDSTKVKAIVMDCGYSSVYNQFYKECKAKRMPARLMMPIIRLLAKLFIKQDIKTPVASSLKESRIPAFFLHGTKDETVPFSFTQETFAAHGADKELALVDGANHTLALLVGGDEVKNKMLSFIGKYFTV